MRQDFTIPTDPARPLVLSGQSEMLLRHFPDNCFDAVVTDPPYELDYTRMSNRNWDATGIAFSSEFWAECLRVLKPGGNLFAFGASRTYHRLTVALEDAGFEIRDSIMAWVKSTGFRKSQDIPALLAKRGEAALAEEFAGFGTGLKPAHEPIVVARKAPEGSIIDNIIAYGVGGLNIDATRVPTDDDRSRKPGRSSVGDILNLQRGLDRSTSHEGGRWPTNTVVVHAEECVEGEECDSACPAAHLENQSKGSSRFFPSFHYQGRAARSERPVSDGVEHLSVKPLALMEWLIRMAVKPGMVVLDPFAGSGATAEAAMRFGVNSVVAEGQADYIPLIEQRVARQNRLTAA